MQSGRLLRNQRGHVCHKGLFVTAFFETSAMRPANFFFFLLQCPSLHMAGTFAPVLWGRELSLRPAVSKMLGSRTRLVHCWPGGLPKEVSSRSFWASASCLSIALLLHYSTYRNVRVQNVRRMACEAGLCRSRFNGSAAARLRNNVEVPPRPDCLFHYAPPGRRGDKHSPGNCDESKTPAR